ncbi:hypothetical protein KSP40_PGU011614 [Platanthera guangdongensis]|uniref:Pentatricopeptide repeat-containing protein n=1 Tax=Platanthera guangdongensis TaxID=2320717 RepID=A0ABR2N0G9_9ASPA
MLQFYKYFSFSLTYTLLIKGYFKEGMLEEAHKILTNMKDMHGLEADEAVYGVLIDAYCRHGKIEDAIRMKDEMLSLGLKKNLFIYNALISGYCKIGKMKEAELLVGEMDERTG